MKPLLSLILIITALFSMPVIAQEATDMVGSDTGALVRLTPDQTYLDVTHRGRVIRIMRIQDQDNLLEKDYTRTSRPCPPFCIQPIELAPEIKTIGELELIAFIEQEVGQKTGLLVDVRMPRFYDLETIPSAVNVPFLLLKSNINDVLPVLGVARSIHGWDFEEAKTLLVFCGGPWCSQSGRAIEALLKANYPADKLLFYRGGMQMWKLLGLSTISPHIFASTASQNQ